MNNFMVRIKGSSEKINNAIREVFTKNFVEDNFFEKEIELKDQVKKREIYMLTENYVDTYMKQYLIKNDDNHWFYSILCEFSVVPDNNNIITCTGVNDVSIIPSVLNVEFYASDVYFENMENEEFQIKLIEKRKKAYKEVKVKNRSVLLLHGYFNYIDKGDVRENKANDIKGLYYYIQENIHNLNKWVNNIEGSFILIYVHYEHGQVNFFFFNDQFGMKSFIFFYEQSSIILTNMYGFFINYDFNYIPINDEYYQFDDKSVRGNLNLIDDDPFLFFFHTNEKTPNKCTDRVVYCYSEENIIKREYLNMVNINEKVGFQINPYYVYNLVLLLEKGEIFLKNVKKENCIYTNHYEWNEQKLTFSQNFYDIFNYFERHHFFHNVHTDELVYLKKIVATLINQIKDHEENKKGGSNLNKGRMFTETKLNNIFINLYLNLLSNVIKKKLEQVFLHHSGKLDQKMEPKGENKIGVENTTSQGGKRKSVGILFSGGIDSTLLTLITIRNFFPLYEDGYMELINVSFNENAVDRYTCLIAYEKIINMFPGYDIRLVLVDVSGVELINYERIIYSLISPNNTTMDYNISSAFFFANMGKGYICQRSFFNLHEWKYIKKKAMAILNINFEGQIKEHTLGVPKEKEQSINVQNKKEEKDVEGVVGVCTERKIKNKCYVCEFVRNKKCVHRCCSICCRKLRYVYIKEFLLEKEKIKANKYMKENEVKNKKDGVTTPTSSSTRHNTYKKIDGSEKRQNNYVDMYEVKYDETNSNKKCIYLLIKKKKIFINFEIFRECHVHKGKMYDYQQIGLLYREFNKELEQSKNEGRKRGEDGKKDGVYIDKSNYLNSKYDNDTYDHMCGIVFDEKSHIQKNSSKRYLKKGNDETTRNAEKETYSLNEECYMREEKLSDNNFFLKKDKQNFIDKFVTARTANDANNFEKIKSLFSKEKYKKGESMNKKEAINKNKILTDYQHEKEEREDESLNFLNRKLYNKGNNEDTGEIYYCNHELLIIGSGADELYGGYYRQNNTNNTNKRKTQENYKMNEMIKDIKRIWNRNLYRDDRIFTFTSRSKKHIFYPYLNIHLVNFLFLVSFYLIEAPILSSFGLEKRNRSDDEGEAEETKEESLDEAAEDIPPIPISEEHTCQRYNVDKKERTKEKDTLMRKENYCLVFVERVEECYNLYRLIKNYKISKWILRMAIFFLKFKELMFFKKKAIQFGSKAKNTRKYMKESITSSFNDQGTGTCLLDTDNKKKGHDSYTLLSQYINTFEGIHVD
ncbi:hypothetical protein MKS88_004331 [Plasmodium brasilianum]|uniref:Asparagine synthase, putative n=2 Tax=Plasmodium (Plasmodium) TaxID=418103 RepID=A0A1A8W861_PLAMA|nr:conserved Plasmodium protein, unknown function [Plasmodium malariae]KAI4836534.1 hypothetical protein MKS88_004331 [Plasmodium brasilianum]SBS88158.1 asparagine synthase, putative [Plasmodium malariae]SCO93810.1 conserved Plasmodium protein, unknown function [Plasmodium malariae]